MAKENCSVVENICFLFNHDGRSNEPIKKEIAQKSMFMAKTIPFLLV
jgi:hypothetical protein